MASGQDQHHPNLSKSAATPLDAVHAYRTTMGELLDDPLPDNPFPTLEAWIEDATRRATQPNPNAMALATANDTGAPSVRVVLCRGMDTNAGSLWFYTNRDSRKGRDLASNPRAAVAFHWDALDRQARVEGAVEPLPEADSDAYFASRRWEKRVGAWASDQSRPVASRRELLEKVNASLRRFGIDPDNPPPPDADVDIPRPPHWGGYRLVAHAVELWVGSPGRIHDRALWTRPQEGGAWVCTRLQP